MLSLFPSLYFTLKLFSVQFSINTRKSTASFEGSQASPACPSGKGNIEMKMNVQNLWNDNGRGISKYCEGSETVQLCSSQALHLLVFFRQINKQLFFLFSMQKKHR